MECDKLRFEVRNGVAFYNPRIHSADCVHLTHELLRMADILEFVEAPSSYNPGHLMRKVQSGKYNLRARKQDVPNKRLKCMHSMIPTPRGT